MSVEHQGAKRGIVARADLVAERRAEGVRNASPPVESPCLSSLTFPAHKGLDTRGKRLQSWSTALNDMLAHVLGTHMFAWTIGSTASQLTTRVRTYRDLNAITREIDDARVWAGLHWRHSTRHGAKIGREVVRHVARNSFKPIP
jgi:hypothetical protein